MRRLFEPGILLRRVLLVAGILLVGCTSESSGAELYRLNCSGCHGTAGQGGLATALSSPAYLATHDDPIIAQLIGRGVPNMGMRAFGKANGGVLTDAQIDLIIRYLRSVRSAQ